MVRLTSANLRPDVPTRSQHEKVRSHSEAVEFSGVLIFGCDVERRSDVASFSPKLMLRCQLPVTYLRLPERRVPPCIPPISRQPPFGSIWVYESTTAAAS
jgi:hypothetical protein